MAILTPDTATVAGMTFVTTTILTMAIDLTIGIITDLEDTKEPMQTDTITLTTITIDGMTDTSTEGLILTMAGISPLTTGQVTEIGTTVNGGRNLTLIPIIVITMTDTTILLMVIITIDHTMATMILTIILIMAMAITTGTTDQDSLTGMVTTETDTTTLTSTDIDF